jgi:hypothetical protein
MAQAGNIQQISGLVTARTPLGQVRELTAGDLVHENDLIETSDNAGVTVALDSGRIIHLPETAQILIDESVTDVIDARDATARPAVVQEVEAMQQSVDSGVLDFSNVADVETTDLKDDGADQTLTLSLDDVLDMTDADNVYHITGDVSSVDNITLTGVAGGDWTHYGNGLFAHAADSSITITIASPADGGDIHVDVDNGDSFDI